MAECRVDRLRGPVRGLDPALVRSHHGLPQVRVDESRRDGSTNLLPIATNDNDSFGVNEVCDTRQIGRIFVPHLW